MTDLQHEVVPETAPVVHHRSTLNRWLAGGLVVALLAVVGLAAWVFYDHNHSDLTSKQTAAVAAVEANLAAHNANDWTALTNTMTTDVVWYAVGGGELGSGPVVGPAAYTQMVKDAGGIAFTELADPVVAGDTTVSVPVSISGGYTATGVLVMTVRDVSGQTKVSEMVWIPEPMYR